MLNSGDWYLNTEIYERVFLVNIIIIDNIEKFTVKADNNYVVL